MGKRTIEMMSQNELFACKLPCSAKESAELNTIRNRRVGKRKIKYQCKLSILERRNPRVKSDASVHIAI
jgi:hypothetical protein